MLSTDYVIIQVYSRFSIVVVLHDIFFQHFVNFRFVQYLETCPVPFKTRLFATCIVSAARITLVREAGCSSW